MPGIIAWGDRNTKFGKWKVAIINNKKSKKNNLRLSWGELWLTSKKPLPSDKWIHVVVTSTGLKNEQGCPTAKFYLDGELMSAEYSKLNGNFLESGSGTLTETRSAIPLLIGSDLIDKNLRNTLHAQIDELYIIDGAINEQQVQQWKNLSVKDQ